MNSLRVQKTCDALLILTLIIVNCNGASIPLLAHIRKQISIGQAPEPALLAFTASRLEKEEKEKGPGIWVDEVALNLENYSNDEDDCDYEYDEIGDGGEDEYDEDEDGEEEISSSKPRRALVSESLENEDTKKERKHEDFDDEHPLRTDEWLVHVNISPLLLPGNSESKLFPDSKFEQDPSSKKKCKRRKRQVMKFAKNGYVVLIEDIPASRSAAACETVHVTCSPKETKWSVKLRNKNGRDNIRNQQQNNAPTTRVTKIGKWKLDTSGVSWSIPVQIEDRSSSSSTTKPTFKFSTLHYHADILLSKFQEQPRMIRGVVTRDHFKDWSFPIPMKKNFFRPVIATFTAHGIGQDTVDISYKNRGFGLNSGALNKNGED